jgi:hypothetical protein
MELSKHLNLNNAGTIYLNDLGKAITKVESRYCTWEYTSKKYLQKIERVFAYELYHQYRIIIEKNKNRYANLRLDGEIQKQFSNNINSCGTNYNFEQARFAPDMVVHLGQIDRNSQNQKLIVEIKIRTIEKKELAKTILKFNHYIRELNFQYAVFLSVNTTLISVAKKLKEIFDTNKAGECSANFKRIIIVCYKDQKIDAKSLYQILN